ncbi:hypothetical protein LWS67_23880, partial [Bacillus atrophaeus]|uniref:hypothetical protein n=1 Tax=Bacillus atrophaeus TaxID=1452 RepID=UPI001EFBB588
MASPHLKIAGLLIVMIALHGCKEPHQKQAGPNLVPGSSSACFADLPHQSPVVAAIAAYERGDRRLLIFDEYGEGNYPV